MLHRIDHGIDLGPYFRDPAIRQARRMGWEALLQTPPMGAHDPNFPRSRFYREQCLEPAYMHIRRGGAPKKEALIYLLAQPALFMMQQPDIEDFFGPVIGALHAELQTLVRKARYPTAADKDMVISQLAIDVTMARQDAVMPDPGAAERNAHMARLISFDKTGLKPN